MNIDEILEVFPEPPISVNALIFCDIESALGLTRRSGWYCLYGFPRRVQLKYSLVRGNDSTVKLLRDVVVEWWEM